MDTAPLPGLPSDGLPHLRPGPVYRLVPAPAGPAAPVVWDPSQQRVIDHDRGRLRVYGGPGTGKSTVLAAAVAERVGRGVGIPDVLALTFSSAAARAMRDQITRRIGRVVTEPLTRTIHSYAFGVLRQAALDSDSPTPRLLSSAERDLILREILHGRALDGRDNWPEDLAAARTTRAFVEELADVVARACEQGLSAQQLRRLGRQHGRPEWVEAASVYAEYLDVTALQSPGAFDAPELIQRAIGVLSKDSRLLRAARRARIFVDEYSDLDHAQLELVALLTVSADEVVVAGDPDQSVFSFRGSDPYAMADVAGVLGGDVDTVLLERVYRGGAELIAATRRIAERLPGPAAHRDVVGGGAPVGLTETPEPAVTVSVFSSPAVQASQIARALRRAHLRDGVGWNEMAVVTRSAADYDVLRRQLSLAGVPVGRATAGALADEPLVALLSLLVRAVIEPTEITDDDAEGLLCSVIGQADLLQVQAFRRRLRLAGHPVGTLATALAEAGLAALAGPRLARSVHCLQRTLAAGRERLDGAAEDVLWAVWSASGIAPRLAQRSAAGGIDGARADRDLDAVLDLFTEAADLSRRSPGGTAQSLLAWLEQLQIADRAEHRRTGGRSRDAVELLSAHAAKGREWDVVCVAGVQDGLWPNLRRRGTLLGAEDLVEVSAGRDVATADHGRRRLVEERRLFYVAITRARRKLLVSAVSDADTGPSRFLDELDPLPAGDGDARPVQCRQRSLDLTGLIGELRATLVNSADAAYADASDADAAYADAAGFAAAELAGLAREGVPGASPRHWWGVLAPSTSKPARDPATELRISPSHLQSYLDCQLRALLEDLAATDGRDVVEAAVGSVVHKIAETVDDAVAVDVLERLADEQWTGLEFEAAWQSRTERARASAMLAKLAAWLSERRGRMSLLGKEEPFRLVVGDVVLSGRVDRLERAADGGLVVIDLKATKRDFTKAEVEQHTQLAVYQMAVAHGLFSAGSTPAGAALVHLGKKTKTSPELRQRPLPEQDDPDRIVNELSKLSQQLRRSSIEATPNEGCDQCPVQACCPTRDDGRHVTDFDSAL